MFVKGLNNEYNLIFRFVISGIIILVIVFALGSITYKNALDMAKANAVDTIMIGLEKTIDIMNARFSEIHNMTTQIFMKKDFLQFSDENSKLSNTDYYKLRKLIRELRQYRITNSYIDDFIILFPRYDIIASPDYAYTNASTYYGKLFKFNQKSIRELEKDLYDANNYFSIWSSQDIMLNNRQKSVITYLRSQYRESLEEPESIILVFVKEEQILKYLRSIDSSEYVEFFIMDTDGDFIVSDDNNRIKEIAINRTSERKGNFDIVIDDLKYTLVYARCPYYNLVYMAAISPEYFCEKVSYVKKVFLLTGVLAFVISLIYIIFIAFHNSKPIRTVIEILKDSIDDNNISDTSSIEKTLSQIISNNKEMQEKLDQQKPILRESLIMKLLLGGFYLKDEIENALSYTGLSIDSDLYVVMLINIHSFNDKVSSEILDELNLSKIITKDIIKRHFQNQLIFCNLDEDKIAIIIGFMSLESKEYKKTMHLKLKTIIDELNKYNIRAIFAIGEECTDLMDISYSYSQAKIALDSIFIKNESEIIWFNDITNKIASYYYPIDIEIRLMRLVKMGEENEVLRLLNNIYLHNFSSNHLSQSETKQFIYEMRGTLVKLCTDLMKDIEEQSKENIFDMLNTLDMSWPLNKIYNNMCHIYKNLCSIVNERKKSHNDKLIASIINYIEKNYDNPDLCLNVIASHFGISDKYLSDFFKEQTGENFSSYVEKIRMNHALELLKDESLSIGYIAKKSGYNSTNTFYKVFKRNFGVSPGTYRYNYNTLGVEIY